MPAAGRVGCLPGQVRQGRCRGRGDACLLAQSWHHMNQIITGQAVLEGQASRHFSVLWMLGRTTRKFYCNDQFRKCSAAYAALW